MLDLVGDPNCWFPRAKAYMEQNMTRPNNAKLTNFFELRIYVFQFVQ